VSPNRSAALELLAGLAGVRAVLLIEPAQVPSILAAEERYERCASIPLENLGIRTALSRGTAAALLKDTTFRKPPAPTLYLVEAGDAPPGEELAFGSRRFRIIGEEVVAGEQAPAGGAVPISDTFLLYPERRSDVSRPSRFLLPPVAFPELETPAWEPRVRAVVSSSPSPLGDARLREICGFPDDPSLATLVVGFDVAAGA